MNSCKECPFKKKFPWRNRRSKKILLIIHYMFNLKKQTQPFYCSHNKTNIGLCTGELKFKELIKTKHRERGSHAFFSSEEELLEAYERVIIYRVKITPKYIPLYDYWLKSRGYKIIPKTVQP